MDIRLINRRSLKLLIHEAANEWGINRKRIPSELIETLEGDFRKQIKMRVASTLNSSTHRPKQSPTPTGQS